MAPLVALASGLVFGAGLALSGMTDPARVRGFLDLVGQWDPTLAFVMGGAVPIMAIAWMFQKRMARPGAAPAFDLPATNGLNRRLALGALLFGGGWGLAGLCPGPAIADLALMPAQAVVFVAAMLGGMALHRFIPG